jgi:hypothetical protein
MAWCSVKAQGQLYLYLYLYLIREKAGEANGRNHLEALKIILLKTTPVAVELLQH